MPESQKCALSLLKSSFTKRALNNMDRGTCPQTLESWGTRIRTVLLLSEYALFWNKKVRSKGVSKLKTSKNPAPGFMFTKILSRAALDCQGDGQQPGPRLHKTPWNCPPVGTRRGRHISAARVSIKFAKMIPYPHISPDRYNPSMGAKKLVLFWSK